MVTTSGPLAARALRQHLTHLPRDDRDTLFLLGVVASVVLPQWGHLPWWCGALSLALLLWRGTLAWHSQPLPSRGWLLVLLALTVAATLITHRTIFGRDAGVTLIVVLLSLKTLELRARRDAFVVFFLGFFMLLSNFFYSQTLLTALAMLVALLGLLTALINAHLPVGRPPLTQSAWLATRLALLGAPVMVVLFLLFPRLAPLWGTPADALSGRSGLSPTMQVGNVAQLALDDSIALRLRFDGTPPPLGSFYLRGPVLSAFDGREWRPSLARFATLNPRSANLQVSGPAVEYEVTMEPHLRPWLLVLEATPRAPVIPGLAVAMTPDLQWLVNRPVTDLLRFRAASYPQFRHGPAAPVAALREDLELPAGYNPRTLALAAQMREDPALAEADAPTLAAAVLQRLRSGGYVYTLEPGVYGEHSADEFWFDRKQGFCEHIASSFVILMRALGVPARVVTGYQGGSLNPLDGYWVVRQSDAHAWSELWVRGQGWVRVDPTAAVAPGRIGSMQRLAAPRNAVAAALGNVSPNLLAGLRTLWDAANNGWNQWVLSYSQARQLKLLQGLGFESPSWEDLLLLLSGCVIAAGLGGALWTLRGHPRADPWLRLLGRARRRLERAGLAFEADATPRQLAGLALAHWGEPVRELHAWLLALEQCRYAAQPVQSLASLQQTFATLAWPQDAP